ncbi:hypothetical protein [Candidatus Poriferisodalis sp.]|uniref:hypothetical protein n=1 Tax=Candidatus Poriferisodalis sp. TaxID=3101277 RepID=UPI003B029F7D
METPIPDGELICHVLCDGYRSLLTIDDLICAVQAFSPVHDVQWEALVDRVDNGFALRRTLNEFTLKRRAYVKRSAIADHTIFVVISVSCD